MLILRHTASTEPHLEICGCTIAKNIIFLSQIFLFYWAFRQVFDFLISDYSMSYIKVSEGYLFIFSSSYRTVEEIVRSVFISLRIFITF